MTDPSLATAAAGSILYKAAQALVDDMARDGSTEPQADTRRQFLHAMRLLAVHVVCRAVTNPATGAPA